MTATELEELRADIDKVESLSGLIDRNHELTDAGRKLAIELTTESRP